jgi:hypothetical protein
VHLRRALLLFALVLALTAVAASLAPTRPEEDSPALGPASPVAPPGAGEQAALTFSAPAPEGRRPERRVKAGAHLIVTVDVAGPGQAAIPRLGRTDSATVDAPGRFDLIAPPRGRYPVTFISPQGETSQIGTIVSR